MKLEVLAGGNRCTEILFTWVIYYTVLILGYWNPTIINKVNNLQKLYHHETYLQFTTDKKDGIPWGSYKQVKVSHI